MGSISKSFALILLVIMALSSLLMVESASAQSIPKPSVPEFTLKFVDHSYDVPTTFSIDPYTGENVTYLGYHVKRVTLEVTIKNQPFVPYYDTASGWNISFYYNIRMKGYYLEDWMELYRPSDGYPTQSDAEYTVISLGTLGENGLSLATNAKMIDVPSGGKVDFQVKAMIGYISRVFNPNANGNQLLMYPYVFTGETSNWSNTQTLSINYNSNSTASTTSPNPTPTSIITPTSTPTVPEFPALAVLAIFLMLSLFAVLTIRKRKIPSAFKS